MSGLRKWQHLKIPYTDIKYATKNFEKCIGKGGYGLVYYGELSIHGKHTKVAVKRLNELFGQGLKEFLTEIELLSGQDHENLIALLGYCDEGKEKILIYEYAERGSLDQYISPCSSNSTYTLTWLERIKICVDAARGISHLHNHAGEHQTIIHRDIKSGNILLDDKWMAKISDLGLSKLSLADFGRSAVISRACGTPGYCEPEYISSGVVTKESDVYSFGVVLFEVLCGRLCHLKDDIDGFMLSHKVKDLYETMNLDEIIEPSLRKQMSPVSMNKFATTAYRCLLDDREQRPPMDLVTKELERSLKIQEEYELKSPSDEYWKIKLPDDVEDILSELEPPLVYTTREELFSLLRQGVFFDHNHRFFSINNDGIKCEVISAYTFLKWKSRSMTWTGQGIGSERGRGRGKGRQRAGRDHNEVTSRCSVMGQYPHIEALNVQCKINTSMLSLGIMYAANLVFSLATWGDHGSTRHSPNILWIKWQCQDLRVSSAHYAQQLGDARKNNGTRMLKATLWHFVNNDKNANFDIVLNRILGAAEDEIRYILIRGIIFQPVDMKQYNKTKIYEGVPISNEDVDWEKNMPNDYASIVTRSNTALEYTTKKELYFLLCNGILIDDGQKWFSLCKSSGGKCHMLPAIEILSRDTNYKIVDGLSLTESRFEKAIRLVREEEHRFICKIDPTMVSSGGAYACYLVFKFVNLHTTPHDACLLRASYKSGWKRGRAYAHLKLRTIDIPIIKPIKNNRFRDSRNIPKIKDSLVPKQLIDGIPHNFMEQRNDGWMEVLLFNDLYLEDNQKLKLSLFCMEGNLIDVIVQGIEFRPLERDIHSLEEEKLSGIFVKWAKMR